MLGSLFGHEGQACNLQNNVLQIAEVVGVDSFLKALKNKGEEDESETFQDACDARKVQRRYRLFFMLLENQKLLNGED